MKMGYQEQEKKKNSEKARGFAESGDYVIYFPTSQTELTLHGGTLYESTSTRRYSPTQGPPLSEYPLYLSHSVLVTIVVSIVSPVKTHLHLLLFTYFL